MDCPPPLIVSDRLADEQLWAEVLSLGGYDLLMKPFDAKEVHHAVSTACRRAEHVMAIAKLRNRAISANSDSLPGINAHTAFGG
jgi:DNA-binding response OmpR family regulator